MSNDSGLGRRVVATLAAVLVLTGSPQIAHATPDDDPTRVLIVGDSVTNGSVGDYTWRYRLWHNLTGPGGADVDFVGPNTGVLNGELDTTNSMEYADPDFDVDHAARWGMSLAFPDRPVGEMVDEYDADVVVQALGLNDLTWLTGSPEDVASLAGRFVETVRSANPAAAVVLMQLPQSWIVKIPEYNALLEQVAADLDEPGARVVVAEADASFELDVDTWDIGHPSATGEVKIARSVAEALAEVGVGAAPDSFPAVVNGPPVPPVLSSSPGRFGEARVSWTMPLGATGVRMWKRPVGGKWVRVENVAALSARPGRAVEVRVQAFKGAAVSPLFSNVVTLARASRGR